MDFGVSGIVSLWEYERKRKREGSDQRTGDVRDRRDLRDCKDCKDCKDYNDNDSNDGNDCNGEESP